MEHIDNLIQPSVLNEKAISYWSHYLENFTDPTPLPGNEPALIELVDGEECQGESVFWLEEEFTSRLYQLTVRYDVSVVEFIQGAWAVLLSRYADRDDVVFGAV